MSILRFSYLTAHRLGQVCIFSIFGREAEKEFSLSDKFIETPVKECKIWPTGLVVMTVNNQFFCVPNLEEPRLKKMEITFKEPYDFHVRNCLRPSCWTIVEPELSLSLNVEVLVASGDTILVADTSAVNDMVCFSPININLYTVVRHWSILPNMRFAKRKICCLSQQIRSIVRLFF